VRVFLKRRRGRIGDSTSSGRDLEGRAGAASEQLPQRVDVCRICWGHSKQLVTASNYRIVSTFVESVGPTSRPAKQTGLHPPDLSETATPAQHVTLSTTHPLAHALTTAHRRPWVVSLEKPMFLCSSRLDGPFCVQVGINTQRLRTLQSLFGASVADDAPRSRCPYRLRQGWLEWRGTSEHRAKTGARCLSTSDERECWSTSGDLQISMSICR